MRLRKLLRFRNLLWLVCFVACASLLLLNGFVGISKTTSKTDFQAPQNHKVEAEIVPKRSSNIAIKAYMKNLDTSESERKELPKERTLSELNLQQSKLFQFLKDNHIVLPKLYENDFLALSKYANYLKRVEYLEPLQTRAVIILTNYRSGSSFFGELLNQHEDIFYVFEPLAPVSNIWSCSNNVAAENYILRSLAQCIIPPWKNWKKKTFRRKARIAPHVAHSCFVKNFCFAPNTKELMSEDVCPRSSKLKRKFDPWTDCGEINVNVTSNMCRRKKIVAIKLIRACDVNYFKEIVTKLNVDLKVLHLVRDPRGISSSRLRLHKFLPLSKMSEFTCKRLKHNTNVGLKETPDWLKGRYKIFRYEDVALHPEKKAREMFEFLNLKLVDSVKNWIANNTNFIRPARSTNSSRRRVNPWDIRRDSKAVVNKWQKHLNFSQVQVIEKYCGEFMNMTGYQSVRNSREYDNKTKHFFNDDIPLT